MAEEYESFATTVRFFAVAGPAPPLFLNDINEQSGSLFDNLTPDGDIDTPRNNSIAGTTLTVLILLNFVAVNYLAKRFWRRV